MKKLFFISFLLVCFSSVAQVSMPPHHVQDAFKQSHPDANHLTWVNENGNFRASYYDQSKRQRVTVYDANDVILRNEYELPATEMPDGISEYFAKNNQPIVDVKMFLVVNSDGTKSYYCIQNEKTILFDKDGKLK